MLEPMAAIRPYTETDHAGLLRLIRELQDHISSLDPLRRLKSGNGFDVEAYMTNTMEKVRKERGCILVADDGNGIIGCVIGIIPSPSPEQSLESPPILEGVILELIVARKHRGSGVGSMLMEAMEQYYREEGAEYSRVSCFAPNEDAHRFYGACGYGDRNIEMLKSLF